MPSVEEERFRDLVRAREDVRGDLMRARHRLTKFLLQQELVYAGLGNPWTQRHRRWLGQLPFDDAARKATFVDYLAAVDALLERRSALERALSGIAAEVGDFDRFSHPRLLAGYLGIVPSERTSDERRRQGAITKAGPGYARRLLVEAVHHYRHGPHIGEELARRQQGQDPRVCQVAWKAQRRLHSRWRALAGRRGKPPGIVAVACARELATFLWVAATLA